MNVTQFPVIDPVATGRNIIRLRKERGMTVRDLQVYFGFEEPQAIYKWQQGRSLPSVDNLYALGALLRVPMEEILVSRTPKLNLIVCEQQEEPCCSSSFWRSFRLSGTRRRQSLHRPFYGAVKHLFFRTAATTARIWHGFKTSKDQSYRDVSL